MAILDTTASNGPEHGSMDCVRVQYTVFTLIKQTGVLQVPDMKAPLKSQARPIVVLMFFLVLFYIYCYLDFIFYVCTKSLIRFNTWLMSF